MRTYISQTEQQSLSPADVLQHLKEGNDRFVRQTPSSLSLGSLLAGASKGQFPMAVIHGCIDSRAPVEQVFDMTVGDLFVSRVAGNVVNVDVIANLEYACGAVGSKLMVVLGHSDCGAVKAACDHIEMANVTQLLAKIAPACQSVNELNDRTSKNVDYLNQVINHNVALSMANILTESKMLTELTDNGSINLVGGVYDVSTGQVHFRDYTPVIQQLTHEVGEGSLKQLQALF